MKTTTYTGHIVDIREKRIFAGEIVVEKGRIAEIRPIESVAEDAPYYLPGLVDAHIHIESSLMLPVQFARVAVRHGVTAAICDPHEITNVLGVEGIDFMVNNARNSRFGFYFGLPSCVPSSHLETAGARIDAAQTRELIKRDDLWFLAEMMNFPGVLADDAGTWQKLAAAKEAHKPIDGHAPGVLGENLRKYIGAGVTTDHECSSIEEAREKIAAGMKVLVREGSAARNFEALYPIIGEHPAMTMLCSDDKHPDDLIQGHIDALVRRGMAHGLSVWDLLQAAALNPVEHYRIPAGMMREGDPATFIAVDNLHDFNVVRTVIKGHEVYNAEQGLIDSELTLPYEHPAAPNNFKAQPITEDDIRCEITEDRAKIIKAFDGELFTATEIATAEGLHTDPSIQKIMVYNRYGNGRPQVAFIRGFDIRRGAIGATIAHDSHNIVVIGSNDRDMVCIANALIEIKGGIGVCDGEAVDLLPLPIAGLMADAPAEEIAEKWQRLSDKTRALGCPFRAPFISMAFMALPVIPELKLTDKGLVDVLKFDFTELLIR